jgi:hypothetical protein
MKLLCQKYLNFHATFLYEISVFTGSSVVLLFICLPSFSTFWWLQFRQSGARTPQCTMLGALIKPSDESVLKVKLLVCCILLKT